MKLRIKGDSIRFRLSQDEVIELHQREEVSSITKINSTLSFKYQLISSESSKEINISFESYSMVINIPRGQVESWATSDQIGLQSMLPNDGKDGLFILIEKDFQCLIPREDENEQNLYPNPLAV